MELSRRGLSYVALLVVLAVSMTTAYDLNFCWTRGTRLYRDPADCGAYYNCFHSQTHHHQCPTGLLFNEARNYCDWPREVDCDSSTTSQTSPTTTTTTTTTTTPSTTTSSTTTSTAPPAPPTNFCQNRADGLYVDPTSCRHFLQCAHHNTHRVQCAAGLLFNPAIKNCDWDYNVDCQLGPQTSTTTTTTPATTTTTTTPATTTTTQSTTTTTPTSASTQSSSSASSSSTTRTSGASTVSTTASSTSTPSTTASTNRPGDDKCSKVVCYFTNWSQYRNGDAKFQVGDVDPSLCTHIVYAFAKLNGNRLAPTEHNDNSTDWQTGNYDKMMEHKVANPNLKVLLAVGGWNMASAPFTAMVRTADTRKEFVDTSITFLRVRRFDGLDLDWEYPAQRGSPPEDKHKFVLLCQELKAAFEKEGRETGRPRLLLTAAVAAGKSTIEAAYDVASLNEALDFISLMSYDLRGGWDPVTGHHSPLHKGSWESGLFAYYNVESAVEIWLQSGAQRDKLIVGLPLYARSFRLTSSSNTGVDAPASGAGSSGPHTGEVGYLSYYEVCSIRDGGAAYTFIDEQKVPYLVWGDQWIGYDDASSLTEKVQFIRDEQLGGAMVWDISLDDFRGTFCGEEAYPLMKAINDECYK